MNGQVVSPLIQESPVPFQNSKVPSPIPKKRVQEPCQLELTVKKKKGHLWDRGTSSTLNRQTGHRRAQGGKFSDFGEAGNLGTWAHQPVVPH